MAAQDNPTRETAIHEAGHAVAFYRLFGAGGRYGDQLTIDPNKQEGTLGSHRAEELSFLADSDETPEERQMWSDEATYACAGYAAVLVAGYGEAEAIAGCDSDFEIAEQNSADGLATIKERAVSLMRQPENVTAVAKVSEELLNRLVLDCDEVDILIDVADGKATDQDYEQYLLLKRPAANASGT